MTISERIFMLLKQKDLKQKDLAAYTGISTSAISAWNKNKTNPAAESLSTIADFLGVSLDFLLTGSEKKSVYETEEINRLIKNYNSVDEISKQLIQERAEALAEFSARLTAIEKPLKSSLISSEKADVVVPLCELPVSAGTGIYLDAGSTEPLKVVRTAASEAANYALRVSGDSMEPEYSDGDIVLIETVEEISEGEIGIFIADGEGFMKVRGAAALISLNATYPPRSYASFESVKCIGRVLGKAELV